MHSAPSVNYPVGRSFDATVLSLWAWLLGAAVVALWMWQSSIVGWRHLLGVMALAIAGAAAALSWWRTRVGELAWDGQAWTWCSSGVAERGSVRVCLDLQRVLLLRWHGIDSNAGMPWLWLERARYPARWNALRRAVYSRAASNAVAGPQPPPATP